MKFTHGDISPLAEERLLRALEWEDRLSIARLVLADVYMQIHEEPSALAQFLRYVDENPDASNVAQVRRLSARIEAAIDAEERNSREHEPGTIN